MKGPPGSRRQVARTTNLASMQNNSGPKPAVKIPANVAEPSADAIYTAYPNQGSGFYCYVELKQQSPNYYPWSSPQDRGKLKPLESRKRAPYSGAHSRLI